MAKKKKIDKKMQKKLSKLKVLQAEIRDFGSAQAVLDWDIQTNMPPGGAVDRSRQMGRLAKVSHKLSTSKKMGKLLESLAEYQSELDPESDDASLIRESIRIYERQARVSSDWVTRFTQATGESNQAWIKARETSEFSVFEPHLEKIVDLAKEYAEFFAPYDHIYDPFLQEFEPDLTTVEVEDIFKGLRKEQVKLIHDIAQESEIENEFLSQKFDTSAQWDMSVDVVTKFGYDWERGRMDKAAHPFTTSFGLGDVRITTRTDENFFNMGIFGSMHECGHALYEQGFSPEMEYTFIRSASSGGVHESQSRLWENLVGRSLPFWQYYFPELQKRFPEQFGGLDLRKFYHGINKVEPSFIRVEADEATYNLHIMLRMEVETAMLTGEIAVKDLPEFWNTRMQEYLGITPKNDSEGVLQDIHWSMGLIGYFPGYALGNVISVQLWEAARKELGDLDELIRTGEFASLLEWLRKNIHHKGNKYMPQDMIKRVTGSKITPEPYLNYLETKYRDIYGI